MPGEDAASPLAVLATFVLVAVVLTASVFLLFFQAPARDVAMHPTEGGFIVDRADGGIRWSDVDVRLFDRAGVDHAQVFLVVPGGAIEEGQAVALQATPSAGTWVLSVTLGGTEIERLTIDY